MRDTYLFLDNKVAYCAGLFEGEGSIFLANLKGYSYVRAAIKMTDLDVLERFQSYVNCGKIYQHKPKKKNPKWKDAHVWILTDKEKIAELMIAFWPYLGKRRREKILELGILQPE